PVVFYFHDLWEWNGENWLNKNPLQRYKQLKTVFREKSFPDWVEFTPSQNITSREELAVIQKNMRQQEIMVISLDSKTQNLSNYHLSFLPLNFHAALMYAHRNTRGPGFEAFSFGIFKGEELVPIAKLSPELFADDMAEIEAYIKENTLEKFGPVRTVNPFFVFELEAEEVSPSNRHKAGVFLKGVKVIARADNYSETNIARVEDLC
ncbi:MAG: hypothetical protein KDD63_26150, partial [Bacteroidetes bacterium]|nr:hypothetical protein [Bacteroidota bacterium]